eukprot:s1574_g3.t1
MYVFWVRLLLLLGQIFEKFDLDRDGVLNLKEFNELQMTTEGSEALYNADQLKSLLLAVNPDMEKPELGMPFADYRRLYLEGRMRRVWDGQFIALF